MKTPYTKQVLTKKCEHCLHTRTNCIEIWVTNHDPSYMLVSLECCFKCREKAEQKLIKMFEKINKQLSQDYSLKEKLKEQLKDDEEQEFVDED